MSDREKCTAQSFPESWEDQPAFREIFLVHLPVHLAESCQKLGDFVFEALLEANLSDAAPKDLMRAMAADLHHVCLVLTSLLEGHEGLDILDGIRDWRDRVCTLADEMKAMTERRTS